MPYGMQRTNYAAGDYYGYAAGGLFGTLGKALGGAVKGFVSGGPLGAVKGAAGAIFKRQPSIGTGVQVSTLPPVLMALPNIPVPRGTPGAVATPGVGGTIQRLLPGGKSGYEAGPGGVPGMSGYHLNKTGYWTSDGYVAPGSKWVRNRSANPGNARALRRAIRREQMFVSLAKRALRGSGFTFKRTGAPKARKRTRR